MRPQVFLGRLLDAGGVDGAHALWPRAAQVVAGHGCWWWCCCCGPHQGCCSCARAACLLGVTIAREVESDARAQVWARDRLSGVSFEACALCEKWGRKSAELGTYDAGDRRRACLLWHRLLSSAQHMAARHAEPAFPSVLAAHAPAPAVKREKCSITSRSSASQRLLATQPPPSVPGSHARFSISLEEERAAGAQSLAVTTPKCPWDRRRPSACCCRRCARGAKAAGRRGAARRAGTRACRAPTTTRRSASCELRGFVICVAVGSACAGAAALRAAAAAAATTVRACTAHTRATHTPPTRPQQLVRAPGLLPRRLCVDVCAPPAAALAAHQPWCVCLRSAARARAALRARPHTHTRRQTTPKKTRTTQTHKKQATGRATPRCARCCAAS